MLIIYWVAGREGMANFKNRINPQDLSVNMFLLPVLGRQASQQEEGEHFVLASEARPWSKAGSLSEDEVLHLAWANLDCLGQYQEGNECP